jgi:hypothetical protein
LKKAYLVILFILSQIAGGHAQNPIWSDGTAFTVSEKILELSVFRPAKFGITKKDEISAHPFAFFVIPHAFYKRRWLAFELWDLKFMMSSRHGLYYPHLALKLNRNLNFGFSELVPGDSLIPHVVALQNELIISHYLKEPTRCSLDNILITGRLGFKYGLKFSSYEHPLIYQSVLYRETAVLVPGFVWYAGVEVDGNLNFMFNYFADLDFYSYGFIKQWSIESKLGIMGYSGERLSGFAGLKLAFSNIPGRNRFLIMPIVDVSYRIDFGKKTNHGTKLFDKDVFKHDNSLDRNDQYYEDLEKREHLKDSIQII